MTQSSEAILTHGLKAMKLRAQQPGGPRWFFETLLNHKIQDWQEELCEAVADVRRKAAGLPTVCNHEGLPRVTVRSCHGTGKTHGLGLIMHWWNFTTYGLVVATAPKQDQLKTRLWPRYRQVLRNAPPWYKSTVDVDTLKIRVMGDPDWGVVAETASEPENLHGYHDTPQLFLVDEASGQRLDPMFPVIEGALTTKGSVCVEIGNPTRSSGEFWAHHNKNGTYQLYYRMHIRPEDSPYVSEEWLENLIKKYGKDSPIVKVRGLGEFVDLEENQLIAYGWLIEAYEKEIETDGSNPRLVVSVDVGAGGVGTTVVTAVLFYQSFTVFKRQEVHSFEAKHASIYAAKAGIEMYQRFNGDASRGDYLSIDMNGPGNGAVGYVLEHTEIPVIGFMGGADSDNKKRWRNRRVQSYWALHDDLMLGRVRFDPNFVDTGEEWDEYCNQLCAIRSRPGQERVEDLETKEQHVKRTGYSPDRADSSMMAYTTTVPTFGNSNQSSTCVALGDMETGYANW